MDKPIARTVVIGEIESRDRKMVNDKKLAEFRVTGLGLRINAWGDLADKVPEDGLVMVEGALKSRTYQNKENQERVSTEITASSVEVIDAAEAADDDDGDLPF